MSRIKKPEPDRSVPLARSSLAARLSSEDLHPLLKQVCFPSPTLDGFGFGKLVIYCAELFTVSDECWVIRSSFFWGGLYGSLPCRSREKSIHQVVACLSITSTSPVCAGLPAATCVSRAGEGVHFPGSSPGQAPRKYRRRILGRLRVKCRCGTALRTSSQSHPPNSTTLFW
jgi:hypothetical protein